MKKVCLPWPSSSVIYSPISRLFLTLTATGCSVKYYGTVVKLTTLVVSSATHILWNQDKVFINLLKVRFADCLLGISIIIANYAYSRSVSTALSVQTQGGLTTEPTNFYILMVKRESFSVDFVSGILEYAFNKSVLCKKKLSNSKIIQSPCFCDV